MQMIEAVIKPNKIDAVKTALAELGVIGMTAVECKGYGKQMGHTEQYRGGRIDVAFIPKVLLKVCVSMQDTDRAVAAIIQAVRSGAMGDGKIFIYPVSKVVRIRTGELDEAAL